MNTVRSTARTMEEDAKPDRTGSPASGLRQITVCICTYKRPEMLKKLLQRLGTQRTDGLFSFSAVVVDNDRDESGAEVAHCAQRTAPFSIEYLIEPEQSISLARNRAVKSAQGDLIAFIDDDEFPDDAWLLRLYQTMTASRSDGVLGPIKPHFDNSPPHWLVKSGILERKSFQTGEPINNPTDTRTGNVLIDKSLFNDENGYFDPRYGTTGGGDVDFFNRMMLKGRRFVFCNEAVVFETVPIERQKRSYYTKRAFTRGMTTAMYDPFLSVGSLKSLVAIFVYTAALPLALLAGQSYFMKYLIKDCDHIGKILKYLGIEVVKSRPY
ncbi:MAG: glycosyltransferase family 2 protein [Syntrophobacterales bacterium]|nr:MAG: glycosyltransferase family 2 protein [Syntrophobacterales bacterium]